MNLRIFVFLPVFALLGCFSQSEPGSPSGPGNRTGAASLQIAVAQAGPFKQIAKTAELKISASDMATITQILTLGDSTISGTVENIPAGNNRIFELKVYDSAGTLQYQGSAIANVTAGGSINLSLTVVRIVGSAVINGQIIESPTVGWTIFDGFEGASLDSKWKALTSASGSLVTTQKHTGSKAFQVTFGDYKFTFGKPISNGQISWWYYDAGGTYFYLLTDTSKTDLTVDNLHMTTVQPAGFAANKYSFYYKVGGYQQVSRMAGWRFMVVSIGNGQISWSVDGATARTVSQNLPVLGFQIAGAIVDDFYAASNTN